jgi:hypothetical protein
MSKGLKQMVAEAAESAQPAPPPKPPVKVSGEALRGMAHMVRQWSGWKDAGIQFGKPTGSPYADCNQITRTFTVNVDALLRNPHRVLNTMTPFRFRQEALMTGVLLHEAGHARHSRWLPRTAEQAEAKPLVHSDGTVPTVQAVKLARLLEEARVEGLMAKNAVSVGADGLSWTMRASNAALLPLTDVSADPNQQIMDVLTSWALRSGKQMAYNHWTGQPLRSWVGDLNSLFNQAVRAHLEQVDPFGSHHADTTAIMAALCEMIICEDDEGSFMIDKARDVLTLLFPETDPENQPEPQMGCGAGDSGGEDGKDGESDEAGEQGEGNTEPEDEGSGDDPGAGDSGSEDSADEDGAGEQPESELIQNLRDLEREAKRLGKADERQDANEAASAASSEVPFDEEEAGGGAGVGGPTLSRSDWRNPTPDEREVQHSAERFLRDMIAPSERSKVTLTDEPSSMIDGAAYAAWKAGGQVRVPRFFKQTRRVVQPSPPVKIAVLVDVSGSMESLQKPSAVLSWALASAALDLRNFAGRGVQVESCLIHWGSAARVVQRNGQNLPGIREVECYEGTQAMPAALEMVEQQIPGFFEIPEHPESRLLVQFTDWELTGGSHGAAGEWIARALAAGVNMLSVVPGNYSVRVSQLPGILAGAEEQRGTTALMRYNPMFPGQVWDTAAEVLEATAPAPDPEIEWVM